VTCSRVCHPARGAPCLPSFAHTIQVAATPKAVYAIIDDTHRTSEWLRRCTKIDNPANGHNSVGTPLTYHYKDGRRTGQMDGKIITHEAGRQFAMNFVDAMTDVTVNFDRARRRRRAAPA